MNPRTPKVFQEFSHWTWAHSDGNLMVTDLQGFICDDGRYILTDPAIHSKDLMMFSRLTNLGERGMAQFFSTHKCSGICEGLPRMH